MKLKQLDFPLNLLFKIRLGIIETSKNGEITQTLILEEKFLYKLLKGFFKKWQVKISK